MPDTCVKLPNVPFDGQIFIDYQRIKWSWDDISEVWIRKGTADEIPLADEETSGLLSSSDKILLDSMPLVGGGFGFIVKPQMVLQAPWNPTGVIQGDIVLHSDSLLVECIDRNGLTLTGALSGNDPIDVLNDPVPGLRFSLSTEFLNTLCLEVYGSRGADGIKGEIGDDGKDGYTDSPAGESGEIGRDASVAHTFSGIKIIELSTIQDSAVVDLDLDQDAGILTYTVAKMNVPEDDEPADELVVLPATRFLSWQTDGSYRTMDDWVLSIPAGDPLDDDPDLTLLQMAPDAHEGRSLEVSKVSLTDYISQVTEYYKSILVQYETAWLSDIKEFVESNDHSSRTILSGLAHQLSECEWTRPLSFCMGIQADDCHPEDPPVPTTVTTVTATTGTTATTATTGTGTTGTGTTASTSTTVAPTTTEAPDEFCELGFLLNEDFCSMVFFRRWKVGDPVVSDCCSHGTCSTFPCNDGISGTCFYGTHRLERVSPGTDVWVRDMSCGDCGMNANGAQLILTLHQDATRLWVNVVLQTPDTTLVWWQTTISRPVDCSTDFNNLQLPIKQLNDLTCGGPDAVGDLTLNNTGGVSC